MTELRTLKRVYVYEDFYHKIMLWGSQASWKGDINRPPNLKVNFPYFLEKYTEKVVKNNENR